MVFEDIRIAVEKEQYRGFPRNRSSGRIYNKFFVVKCKRELYLLTIWQS